MTAKKGKKGSISVRRGLLSTVVEERFIYEGKIRIFWPLGRKGIGEAEIRLEGGARQRSPRLIFFKGC